jgi:hypothetical protein
VPETSEAAFWAPRKPECAVLAQELLQRCKWVTRLPVHMIRLTEEQMIGPYAWTHPDDDERR